MGSSGKLITTAEIVDDTIVNADVNASAALSFSKLQTATSGHVVREVSAGTIGSGFIVNGNVDTAAGITVSKLAPGGTANRVVATADGTTMAMQQILTAMLAANAVTNVQMAFASSDVTLTGTTAVSDMNAAQMTVNYASSGGSLFCFVSATVESNAAGDWIQVGISINGVTWTGQSFRVPTAGYYTGLSAFGMETPAAGSIVVKPRWQQGLSGSTSKSYGSGLKMFIIEFKK